MYIKVLANLQLVTLKDINILREINNKFKFIKIVILICVKHVAEFMQIVYNVILQIIDAQLV